MVTVGGGGTNLEDSEITVSDANVDVGSNFEVTVSTSELLEEWGVTAYQFDIGFDSSVIAYEGYSISGTLSDGGMVAINDQTEGIINVGYMTTTSLIGAGTIIELEFTALNSGTSALDISNFLYNATAIVNLNDGLVTVDNGTHLEDSDAMSIKPFINYPNPFKLSTTIQFNNKKAGHIKLDVYNSVGQKVKTLVDREVGTGTQSFNWDGTNEQNQSVSTGVYFYKLKQGRYTSTKKMILMK